MWKHLKYSVTPIIQTLVICIAKYPDRLGPSANFVQNSTKPRCLKITGYQIEYNTVKCHGCLELQIRCGWRFKCRHTLSTVTAKQVPELLIIKDYQIIKY
jgi:hypothetical protein